MCDQHAIKGTVENSVRKFVVTLPKEGRKADTTCDRTDTVRSLTLPQGKVYLKYLNAKLRKKNRIPFTEINQSIMFVK